MFTDEQWKTIQQFDAHGKSYHDILKRYVHLQERFDEYQRQSRMRFVAMIAICWVTCVVHFIIFILRLILG